MRQPRIIKAFMLSLLISGSCTYLLSRKMNSHRIVESIPDSMYVAPSRSLKAGETLKAENIELTAWPSNRPLQSGFLKTAEVVGRTVLYPLDKDEPFLARDLAVSGAGPGLAAKIPDGMRAIALRSDEIVGVAGFLNPGSHVDVLVTYRMNQDSDPMTTTVLQDSEVVAVGQRTQPDPEGKPATVTVVTLLLSPEEAERAVLASTQGSVRFLLRNSSDTSHTKNTPMLLSMISGANASRAPRVAGLSVPVSTRRIPEIETVLGNESGQSNTQKGKQL